MTWTIRFSYLAVLALVLPSIGVAGAAVVYANPVEEQLVEGHTVFAVLEARDNTTTTEERFAAAVAVLVREYHRVDVRNRFPGVLWFNDQYLVNPSTPPAVNQNQVRYPCNGGVVAKNTGGAVPTPADFTPANYNESYFITDPNDHMWTVDKYLVNGEWTWVVAILGDDSKRALADDGATNCPPWSDSLTTNPALLPQSTRVRSPGDDNGQGYPCQGCPRIQYNALLYFKLEDLTAPGADKDHRTGSTDRAQDSSGCQTGTSSSFPSNWPCPGNNDDREGNSHPYNPEFPLNRYAGRDNHGGSADCDATNPGGDQYCHATRNIDIYYLSAAVPPVRTIVVNDVEGSIAPYHCHEDIACDAGEAWEANQP